MLLKVEHLSPLRIPRNNITIENDQIDGLFPCGEGAGYAGGIMSVMIDGEKLPLCLAKKLLRKDFSNFFCHF